MSRKTATRIYDPKTSPARPEGSGLEDYLREAIAFTKYERLKKVSRPILQDMDGEPFGGKLCEP